MKQTISIIAESSRRSPVSDHVDDDGSEAVRPRKEQVSVDEEHETGSPDPRAPWERPIADSSYRESRSSRRSRSGGVHRSDDTDPDSRRHESARNRRAADSDDPEQLTVAELLDKMGRRSDPSPRPDPPTDPPPADPPHTSTSSLPPARPRDPESARHVATEDDAGRTELPRRTPPPAAPPTPSGPPSPPVPPASSGPPTTVAPPVQPGAPRVPPGPSRPRPPEKPVPPHIQAPDRMAGLPSVPPPVPTPPASAQPPRAVPPADSRPVPPADSRPVPPADSRPVPPAGSPQTVRPPQTPPRQQPPIADEQPTVKIDAVSPEGAASPAEDENDDRTTDEKAHGSARPRTVGNATLGRLAQSKQRKRKRLRFAARAAVAFVSVLAFLCNAAVWGYVRSTEAGFSQIAALDTESEDIVDPVGQTGDETYLIIGTDTRAGASGEIGAGTVDDAEGARADTVILVNIPADRSRVVAVSFPRDLDVDRPVCRGWDSTTGEYDSELYPAAEGDKLNATYALGGPKCLVKVIQKMSGLRIGHFVGIDFAGFESMVDEIGGVEVCTSIPLYDNELGPLIETPGTHTLDGKRALDYVRARKIDQEGNSDYGRISRQQKFLSSLLRSTLSNKVLFDPVKLNGFISAFTRATFVENVNAESLVKLGRSMQNVEAGAVSFLTIPTAGTNDWGNEIPRTDDIKAIFTAIIDDLPLPGEKRGEDPTEVAAAPPAEPLPAQLAVDPSTVSVQVSNASGLSGLAAGTAEEVAAYGFPVYSIGNYASGTSKQTVIRFSEGQETDAATVASAFPGAVLQEAPPSAQLGSIVEIVLGTSFDGTVVAPTPAGTPLAPMQIRTRSESSVELPADLAITNAADDLCT
ncbi:LytR family transcriptional regulator [Rhodococcus pyridinivorans SB3094]|uniref:LytR family transcriptional regulator n=1 Tax=Rhodococcus pyridinivorans SB3094 TaxID=1435356 RepID=V9XH46_9NOCA|nr:LytR family transcriptional regulator [Rhodococcus pyridinivorans SB3094]